MTGRGCLWLTIAAGILLSCGPGGTELPQPRSTISFTWQTSRIDLMATAVVTAYSTLITGISDSAAGPDRRITLSYPGTMTGSFSLHSDASLIFEDSAVRWYATHSDTGLGAALELNVEKNGAEIRATFTAVAVSVDSAQGVDQKNLRNGSIIVYAQDITGF